ncbi:hypothetical protein SNE40_016027 [Patella caerulea]|uniref:Ig-like domain-containing protein n=1 Tax=Patella caerulea TaxID=87958 RepID=A0AAN8JD09_PATCE
MNAPVSTVTITNKNSYIFTDGQDTNVTCKTAIITWSIISGINLGNGTTINNTDGTTTSILQYTADKSDDKNTLLCTATNGYGSPKTDTVMLDILYLDEVSISLDNNKLEGSEAHPVSISCSSNSNPVALITWYNGTTKLSSAQSNNDTFTIQQATCLDTGDYICNVKNRAIPQLEYNRTIELRIICSPRRDTRCSSTPIVSGNITDIVQLVADVISYPPPTFTWYHSKISTGDVEPIYNDDVYEQIDTNSSINTYKSTLHINITSNIFYTSYTVNVSNDVGYMELEYQVKPQLESAIPQTSEASHILLMVESGVGVLVFIIIIISVVVTLVRKLKQPKTSEEEPSPYDNLNMDTIKTNDTDSTYNEVGSSSDSTGITGHHTTHPQTNQNYDFEDSATYENPNMGEYYQDVGNVRTPVDGHEDDSKHTYVNTKKGDNPAYATVDKRKWNGV